MELADLISMTPLEGRWPGETFAAQVGEERVVAGGHDAGGCADHVDTARR